MNESKDYYNFLSEDDRIKCEKVHILYNEYQKNVISFYSDTVKNATIEMFRSGAVNNLFIAKIIEKNRHWNDEMKNMEIDFLDDFFLKHIKEALFEVKGIPDPLKNALYYL